MTRSVKSMFVRLSVGLAMTVLGVCGLAAPPALALDAVSSYTVAGSVSPDGTLDVSATIKLEGAPSEVRQRFATTLDSGRDHQYRYTLTGWQASVGGQPVTPTVTTDGTYQVVSVPTSGKAGDVALAYQVRGAAIDTGDSTTTLTWRLLQGLNLPVRTFDATIKVPGLTKMIDCAAGSPTAPGACGYYVGGTGEEPDPIFHDGPRGAGEVVQVSLRFSSSAVAPDADLVRIWTLDNAFSVDPIPMGAAALVAALGGLVFWLLHRRYGRDAVTTANPTTIGAFRPVGAGQSAFELSDASIRPGEVGTLADERVDPIDVTASLLDLAVRDHLVIEELARASRFAAVEWTLARGAGTDDLRPYEKTILDAVVPDENPRKLADAVAALAVVVPRVQAELYDEVVRQGWFGTRPDRTRVKWARLSWIALFVAAIAAGLLIAFTQLGLLGLVLLALAGGVYLLGGVMPARTAEGSSLLAGLDVLRGQLMTQPTDQLPQGREHEELAKVLPYAVVLGGADRWLDGFAETNAEGIPDNVELTWYHAPEGWQLTDLPDSLRTFLRTLQGSLYSR